MTGATRLFSRASCHARPQQDTAKESTIKKPPYARSHSLCVSRATLPGGSRPRDQMPARLMLVWTANARREQSQQCQRRSSRVRHVLLLPGDICRVSCVAVAATSRRMYSCKSVNQQQSSPSKPHQAATAAAGVRRPRQRHLARPHHDSGRPHARRPRRLEPGVGQPARPAGVRLRAARRG